MNISMFFSGDYTRQEVETRREVFDLDLMGKEDVQKERLIIVLQRCFDESNSVLELGTSFSVKKFFSRVPSDLLVDKSFMKEAIRVSGESYLHIMNGIKNTRIYTESTLRDRADFYNFRHFRFKYNFIKRLKLSKSFPSDLR